MKIPKFNLVGSDGKTYTEKFFDEKYIVLFAYPKDNTPGCTIENQDFTKLKEHFAKKNITVVGISLDDQKSHEKFCQKLELQNLLLSDPEKQILVPLEAFGEKKMYGKIYQGVIRSTFYFANGELKKEWRNINVKNHAENILAEL